jgi:DNA polymerase I
VTLDAWYADRPEVKRWQDETRAQARRHGRVTTMMGRSRDLPDAVQEGRHRDFRAQAHALRAAINTPIQGSAADIVMMAMLRIWRSQVLRDLGWQLLLQIHDEVILEGPKEHGAAALAEVVACMEQPFDGLGLLPMRVKLEVDAKSADSWYKAK